MKRIDDDMVEGWVNEVRKGGESASEARDLLAKTLIRLKRDSLFSPGDAYFVLHTAIEQWDGERGRFIAFFYAKFRFYTLDSHRLRGGMASQGSIQRESYLNGYEVMNVMTYQDGEQTDPLESVAKDEAVSGTGFLSTENRVAFEMALENAHINGRPLNAIHKEIIRRWVVAQDKSVDIAKALHRSEGRVSQVLASIPKIPELRELSLAF